MAENRKKQGGTINMTPMIDITFLLLIFFLVAANFVREGNIMSSLPTDPGYVQPVDLKVRVENRGGSPVVRVNSCEGLALLDAGSRVRVNIEQGVATVSLAEHLKSLLGKYGFSRERTRVTVDASPDAEWQFSLGVYNSVVAAGYQNIAWKVNR